MPPKAVEPPALFVVIEPFIVDENGAPGMYALGEVVPADDPYVKLLPGRFRPYEFPHRRARSAALLTPEVRAD